MRLTLARKIWLGLMGTLLLAVMSSSLALLFALRSEQAYKDIITDNLQQANAIHELVIALLEQNGVVSSYVLEGSPRWLDELTRKDRYFEGWLARADAVGLEPDQLAYINQIQAAFREYASKRDEVMKLCGRGTSGEAEQVLIEQMSARYGHVYQLCQGLSAANSRDITAAIAARHAQAQRVSLWVGVCLVLLTGLTAGLAWLFLIGVFRPLRRMTEDMHDYLKPEHPPVRLDEVQALGSCVQRLKSNVAEARSSLAQSNRRLLDAEKLATVGKLAAGVAHEIRSPLTSLKLRLFSMQKALRDDPRHQNDVGVMSEEITRLDYIIRNFLEFSRPPELRRQQCDVSLLLDKTLELLRYKLEAGNMRLDREEVPSLPPLLVDPQQLRQVLINLLNNAIEAQPQGGSIRLAVGPQTDSEGQEMVVIRVRDTGPGIPDTIISRVFDPFFTTKSDGAGLGLWIAHRVMTQHGGVLEIEESAARGTVFAVWIPTAQRSANEQDTGRGRRPECAGCV